MDPHDVAKVCVGWISTQEYSINDAFVEGLAVGAQRPKRLFSGKLGAFTFFFSNSEKKALKEVRSLKDPCKRKRKNTRR